MRKFVTAAMMILVTPVAVFAGEQTADESPTAVIDLSTAYSAAVDFDQGLAAARENLVAGLENEAQSRALSRPKVKVDGAIVYNRTTIDAELPPVFQGAVPLEFSDIYYTATVGVEQPVYDRANGANARQLREKAKAVKTSFDSQQQQFLLRVADHYFGILSHQAALTAIRAQQSAALREKQAAERRFQLGHARIPDVREAEAQADLAAASQIGLAAKLMVAISRFEALTGLAPETLRDASINFSADPPDVPLEQWQTMAATNAPEVRAKEHALNIALAEVDRHGWRSRPKLSAFGQYQQLWRAGDDSRLPFPRRAGGYTAGLKLSIPIYAGGSLTSQHRAALAKAREAALVLENTRREARLKAQEAYFGMIGGAVEINARRAALASARSREKAAITGRSINIRTQYDVLAMQSERFETERALRQTIYDYQLSKLTLFVVAGQLLPSHLAEVDMELPQLTALADELN